MPGTVPACWKTDHMRHGTHSHTGPALRRTALSLATLTALAGCSLLAGGDDGPTADDALRRLAGSLEARSLADAPLADDAWVAVFAAQVSALDEHGLDVRPGSTQQSEDAATGTLRWTWQVDDRTWEYDTEVSLVRREDRWLVDWEAASLVPGLERHDLIDTDRLPADRGDVLGAGGAPLVTARPVVRYGLDKSRIDAGQVAPSATAVAKELDIDPVAFRAAAEAAGPKAFVEAIVLREEDARDQVRPSFSEVPGALALPDEIPLAPTRGFAAPLLGTVGPATAEVIEQSEGAVQEGDVVGLSGLQARYDDQLAGIPGVRVEAVPLEACDAWPECPEAGESRELTSWPAEPGRPLRLTLDADAQVAAEQALATAAGEASPPSALVALRPSTGEVLAAANGPGNDGLNAATFGQYAPGSTFKVVTTLALLRTGLRPDDVVTCSPTVEVDGKQFENYDDYPRSGLGEITLTAAVASSCNTALIRERDRLGADDLTTAAASLGVGVDHDLGFPAYFGQVPPPDSETEKAADLIGQGTVLASPMAMATVAASVAAGRTVVPHLVDGVAPAPTAEVVPLTPDEVRDLRAVMRAVVTGGSGRFLADVPGEVGAKTGTAEYGTPSADGSLPTHTWMIATRGDLAVAVFVETGQSGSQTAGPILEQFLRATP